MSDPDFMAASPFTPLPRKRRRSIVELAEKLLIRMARNWDLNTSSSYMAGRALDLAEDFAAEARIRARKAKEQVKR